MRPLLALPLLLCSAAAALAQTPATATYHDDAMKLTFTYPAAFVSSSEGAAAMSGAVKQSGAPTTVTQCLSTPLMAVRPAGEKQEELLMLVRLDIGCMGASPTPGMLEIIATNSLQSELKSIGQPTLLPPVSYQLDGHDAVFVQGSAPDARDGNPGYSGVACVLVDKVVLCSAGLTAYPGHLPELFATRVSVADHAAVPMVPPDKIVRPAGPDPKPAATPAPAAKPKL